MLSLEQFGGEWLTVRALTCGEIIRTEFATGSASVTIRNAFYHSLIGRQSVR